jgi:hypothetical protein
MTAKCCFVQYNERVNLGKFGCVYGVNARERFKGLVKIHFSSDMMHFNQVEWEKFVKCKRVLNSFAIDPFAEKMTLRFGNIKVTITVGRDPQDISVHISSSCPIYFYSGQQISEMTLTITDLHFLFAHSKKISHMFKRHFMLTKFLQDKFVSLVAMHTAAAKDMDMSKLKEHLMVFCLDFSLENTLKEPEKQFKSLSTQISIILYDALYYALVGDHNLH